MPKKGEKLSQEQLEKMQAGRKKNKNTPQTNTEQGVEVPTPVDHDATDPGLDELKAQVAELMRMNQAFMAGASSVQPQGAGLSVDKGRLIGIKDRYSMDFTQYPDPRERLAKEPRLARIAFDHNYELEWEVGSTSYETKSGINQQEPKFNLKLNRVVLDDEGERTNARYKVCQMVFFEDPQTAIVTANENGLSINDENEMEFLNEMRYLRVRDWLLECFWPKPQSKVVSNKRDMVIGGKQVEYFEVSSEESAKIPFDQLTTKV